MANKYRDYKGTRVLGRDPQGNYVLANGKTILEDEYRAATGQKPLKAFQKPAFSNVGKKSPGQPSAGAKAVGGAERFAKNFFNLTPKERAKVLNREGFNVKAKRGPDLAAASWAYTRGHSASFFKSKDKDWRWKVWEREGFAAKNPLITKDSYLKAAKPKVTPPAKTAPKPVLTNGSGIVKPDPATTTPSGGQGDMSGLLNDIIGLDPNTGQYIPRSMIDQAVSGSYDPAERDLSRSIAKNPAELATALGDIKRWYGDVGKGVTQARNRGASLTQRLVGASGDNARAILGAIGGEAALGGAQVAQTGVNNANTIQALGAIDQQYLNDVAPLLSDEAANASRQTTAQFSQRLRDYQEKLRGLQTEEGGARAKGYLDAIQANNQTAQQAFANRASQLQTAGALAISNEKAANYLGSAQAKAAASAQNQGVKTLLSRIDKANQAIGSYIDPSSPAYAAQQGGLAPKQLVQDVLNFYRSNLVPLTDPRARQAAAATIQTFGFKVDPHWVNGWR